MASIDKQEAELKKPAFDGLTPRQVNELHAVADKMRAENHFCYEVGNVASIDKQEAELKKPAFVNNGLTPRQVNEIHAIAEKMRAQNHFRHEAGNAVGMPSLAGRDRDETNFAPGTAGMGVEAANEAYETSSIPRRPRSVVGPMTFELRDSIIRDFTEACELTLFELDGLTQFGVMAPSGGVLASYLIYLKKPWEVWPAGVDMGREADNRPGRTWIAIEFNYYMTSIEMILHAAQIVSSLGYRLERKKKA